MIETYRTALTLLTVGMITVFSVLALVVFFGQLLIKIVNRYFPGNTPPEETISKQISKMVKFPPTKLQQLWRL